MGQVRGSRSWPFALAGLALAVLFLMLWGAHSSRAQDLGEYGTTTCQAAAGGIGPKPPPIPLPKNLPPKDPPKGEECKLEQDIQTAQQVADTERDAFGCAVQTLAGDAQQGAPGTNAFNPLKFVKCIIRGAPDLGAPAASPAALSHVSHKAAAGAVHRLVANNASIAGAWKAGNAALTAEARALKAKHWSAARTDATNAIRDYTRAWSLAGRSIGLARAAGSAVRKAYHGKVNTKILDSAAARKAYAEVKGAVNADAWAAYKMVKLGLAPSNSGSSGGLGGGLGLGI